ncbi:MAG: hypothetical protein M3Q36_02510 [bacterium]|nr:hypothetical protein [bacterium]
MKSIEVVPPIIVALDVPNINIARRVVDSLTPLGPDHVAYQVRAPYVHTDFMHELIDDGYFVIGAMRYSDAPKKMSGDILATFHPTDEHDKPRSLPHAITVTAPKTTDVQELACLTRTIKNIHLRTIPKPGPVTMGRNSKPKNLKVNPSLIATARPEDFHHSDHEQIGEQALLSHNRAQSVGIDSCEILFNGLEVFLERKGDISGINIVVSKLSLSGLNIRVAAKRAYMQGADSILLGESVIERVRRKRSPIPYVEKVLAAQL